MPHRICFLYDRTVSAPNCISAEFDMAKQKPHNRLALRILKAPEGYGASLSKDLQGPNTWMDEPVKQFELFDPLRGKWRHICVPSLKAQAVHHAVMRVTVPFLMARNYYYNCGCIPGAGQIRACRALKRWLAKHKIIKYGGEFDVKKFYDNLPHKWVMKCLERIFKDKRFLALHVKILKTMPHKIKNGEAVGVAIGFYPSPWYANLVLSYIDRLIKKVYPDCHFARYMDDISVLGNNKRKMHRVAEIIRFGLARFGLELKPNWQIFQIAPRGVRFLSYRFFHGFTILKKPLLYRLARRFSHARRNLTAHKAAGLLSSMGILKHCNSYHFRRDYVYNNVSIAKMKGLVRNEALRNQSRVRPPARRPDCYAFA